MSWNYKEESFYVTLKPQQLTVTFMFQDAGKSEFVNVKEAKVFYNGSVNAEDVPSHEAEMQVGEDTYTFYGWYTDDTFDEEASLENITADTIVYAKYAKKAALVYYKNCGSDSAEVPDRVDAGVGNTVTIGSAERDGYALESWNTDPEGNGTSYAPGDKVTLPAEGLKLYAQWSEDKVTIKYYRNYNRNDRTPVVPDVTCSKGVPTNLTSTIPTRNNQIFLGWAESSNGDAKYMPGDSFTPKGDSKTYIFYAKWGDSVWNNLDVKQLTANEGKFTYNGKKQEVSGVTQTSPSNHSHDGYVYLGRHGNVSIYADIKGIKASGTDVGHYSTPVSAPVYAHYPNTWQAQNRYIPVTGGGLDIEPVEVTVTTESAEKLYDGEPLTAGGKITFKDGEEDKEVTFTADGEAVTLVNEETLNIKADGSQTEIGESTNTVVWDWGTPDGWGSGKSTASKYNYNIAATEDTLGTLTVYGQIKFDKNAGEDEVTDMPDDKAVYPGEYAEGTALPENEPQRQCYIFKGWSAESGAEEPEFQPEDTIKLAENDNVENGVLTLYAIWEENHTPAEPVEENRVEATCTEKGSYDEVVKCEVCEKELSRESKTIDELGHDWGEWKQTEAPTVEKEGVETRKCSRGDAEETRPIKKLVPEETTTAAEEPTTKAEEPTTKAEEPTTTAEEPTTTAEEPTTTAAEPTTTAEEPTTTAEEEEPTEAEEEEEEEETITYRTAKGDVVWYKGSSKKAVFIFKRSVDDETTFSHFKNFKVGRKTLAKSDYDVKSGSAVVTLDPEYLETLDVGEYDVTAMFDDGNTSSTLTIKKAKSKKDDSDDEEKKDGSPATGDSGRLFFWGAIFLFSMSVLSILAMLIIVSDEQASSRSRRSRRRRRYRR